MPVIQPPDEPEAYAGSRFEMIGRGNLLAWFNDRLQADLSPGLLLLSGRPGIGKSTLLRTLQDQFPGRRGPAVYVDAAKLSYAGWSSFLWSLTQAIAGALRAQGLDAPAVEKRQYVIRPQRAFRDHFWQPLLAAQGSRSLTLLIDHFDVLLEHQVDRLYGRELRAFVEALPGLGEAVGAVLATSVRWECLARHDLAPLLMSEAVTVSPLQPGEAAELVNSSVAAFVPDGVHDYLYRLTRGHPADLRRLAAGLDRRVRRHNLALISHADVLAVLAAEVQPADMHGAVYRRRARLGIDFGTPLPN